MTNYYEHTKKQWKELIRTTELPETFLICYAPCFDYELWKHISQYQSLHGTFMYRFRHVLDIKGLLSKQRIHQNTIFNYWDMFETFQWDIFKNQYISENFIIEHYDHLSLDLKLVLEFQPHLSPYFIKEFFPIAYHGEYVPLNSKKRADVIHESNRLRNFGEINDMIENHNKRIEEMSRIHVSSPQNLS